MRLNFQNFGRKTFFIFFFLPIIISPFKNCFSQTTLIATNASWKYLDNGSNQGTTWRDALFNDASWKSGAAELGFGDSPTTAIKSGKVGYYFRKAFSISNAAIYSGYVLKIRRDDGIVVYVNNAEVYRNNMPASTIAYNTNASTTCSDDGSSTLTVNLPTTNFSTGNNIIAVEVHNSSASSGDVTFVLQLLANPVPCAVPDINSSGADSLSQTAARIFWNSVAGVQSYNFKYRVKNTTTYSSTISTTATFIKLNNLATGTTYEYTLQTVCPGNILSAFSATKSFTTLANPCQTPNVSMFGTIEKTETSAKVYWSPVPGNPTYNVRFRKRNVSASYSSPISTVDTLLTLNNLVASTNYEFTVQAICTAGFSSAVSASGWFTTLTPPPPLTLSRGPYMTIPTKDSICIQWRTSVGSNSKVKFGLSVDALNDSIIDTTTVTEHSIMLRNLTENTKYFYSIGSTVKFLQGDLNNFFYTAPPNNTTDHMKFWVIGDFGNGSSIQTAVRNSFTTYSSDDKYNGWLWVGDNAYSKGADNEYQLYVFNVYQSIFKNLPLLPTPGNHDYASSGYLSVSALTTNFPYFSIFNLPTSSGTEKYYSTNYGNIHFISLDSYGSYTDPSSDQYQWLFHDLNDNTQKWTIVFFHHPPYSKGSHNSDVDIEMVNMRNNIVPLLESYGVDLVLSGHSHNYERSYFIKNHYGQENTFDSTSLPTGNIVQSGGGPYFKTSNNDSGTVYVVCGVAGEIGTGTSAGYPHDAMYKSINNVSGSLILEVDDDTLSCKFLTSTGVISDDFSIIKSIAPSSFRIRQTDNLNDNGVRIYPNPTHRFINIAINNVVQIPVKITISDISGKIIYSKTFLKNANSDLTVDRSMNDFPSGIYNVNVVGDMINVSKRLIVY